MSTYDVLVVGDYCLDLIFTGLDQMPQLGVEIVSRGFAMVPGGTYNTVAAMHNLGIGVGWAGDFGNDEFSQMILAEARKDGLDTSLFVHHNRPLRKITVVASYPKDRAFLAYYDPDPAVPAAMKALTRVSAQVLYIPGLYYGPAFDAGQMLLKMRRMAVIMDGNTNQDATLQMGSVQKAVRSARVFMPNAREARQLTGEDDLEQAARMLGKLCPLVVIKDGANGAYAFSEDRLVFSPALPVEPVDTTGAGDCFNAGFVKAWLQKRPLEECLRWGNIVGGLSTLQVGGAGRRITEADVQAQLRLMNL